MNDTLRSAEWEAAYGSLGAVTAQLTNIPLDILDPWTGTDGQSQPFHEYPESKLLELAENIEKNGVIEPICVRPMPTGRYQIVAGHNRVAASRLVGLATVPALVQQMSDEEAALRMVDSNLQHREQLLPSEKAYAYLERMNALKRIQRSGGAPVGKSRTLLAAETKESATQIQRYIRLTHLCKYLLDQVDAGRLALRAAVSLSYLITSDQAMLISMIEAKQCKMPSIKQCAKLQSLAMSDMLDDESMLSVLCPTKVPKKPTVKLPMDRIYSFFSNDTTVDQMEAEIYNALAFYRKNRGNV